LRGPEDGQVHRFRAGGREGDLGAVGAERARGEIPSAVECGSAGSPFGMQARWVAVGKGGAQRLANFGEDGRRAGVV
jgi:hypothetical protein